MENCRKSSHAVYDLKFHIVWITKYHKPILRADIAQRARDLIREIYKSNDMEIIKGKASRKMMMEFKTLSRVFWGRHIWARGYFAASSGNVKDEVIMKYIEQQSMEPPDGDFKTDDDL